MSVQAATTFSMQGWDEKPYDEFDGGRKLTRTHAAYAYQGDLEGESRVEYLMAYAHDGTGSFVGLERVTGRLGGRAGSFVIQHTGTFTPTGVQDTWFIAPGSGTDGLEGVTGSGRFDITGHGPYPITFEYQL